MQYANIEALVEKELRISPSPFTPWTSSSFYSPQGLQVGGPQDSSKQLFGPR